LFIIAIVGFGASSAYGWVNGDPKKLLIGWDSDGNGCGFSEATKDYPVLYWAEPPGDNLMESIKNLDFNGALEMLNTGACVKECPSSDSATVVDCKRTQRMANSPDFEGCTFQIGLAYLEKWLPQDAVEAYVDSFY